MLTPWLEIDGAAARIEEFSEASGLDLGRLGTTADAEEIKDTAITQPLIVATTLLAYESAGELPATAPTAGHSIGELAAAAIAGVLSARDAVALAAVRGKEMAAACALEPTGMAATMGGDRTELLAGLAELELTPANQNGAGQIVAAGALGAIEKLAETRPGGARVIPLKVAGAFHTQYMAPAQEAFSLRAKDIEVADPTRPLLSNVDGSVVTSGKEFLDRIVKQITNPVRWDSCMATLSELGVTATVEFPPAGTLTGLVKRELKPAATLAVKTPVEAEKLADFVRENGEASQ